MSTLGDLEPGGSPLPPITSSSDPDWQSFQDADADWYLTAASRAVRRYCGWRIFPSETLTADKLRIGSHGIIMLPSRHVTAVASVAVQHPTGTDYTLDPTTYTWFQNGVIQPNHDHWWGWGAFYGNDPRPYLPGYEFGIATATFTSGYTSDCPADVKAVIFELATQAMQIPAGSLKMLEAPGGFRAQFSQDQGLSLTPDQKDRLSPLRIGGVR